MARPAAVRLLGVSGPRAPWVAAGPALVQSGFRSLPARLQPGIARPAVGSAPASLRQAAAVAPARLADPWPTGGRWRALRWIL